MNFLQRVLEACGHQASAAATEAVEAVEAAATPDQPTELFRTTDGFLVGYAYNPRQAASSNGAYHLVVDEVMVERIGRLHRQVGDALCKPAGRFWHLQLHRTESEFNTRPCARCKAIRARIGEAP